jgi:MFS family permease
MSYMLEERVHIDPSKTQIYTTILLTSHGFVGLVSAPIIAHLAEKNSSQRKSLLVSLAGCLVGTLMIAFTSSGSAILQLHIDFIELIEVISMAAFGGTYPTKYRRRWHMGDWFCSSSSE